jgi:hypothetical protein
VTSCRLPAAQRHVAAAVTRPGFAGFPWGDTGPVTRSRRCDECGGPLPAPAATGRPRRYCSPRCRKHREHAVARDRAWANAPATIAELIASLASDPL